MSYEVENMVDKISEINSVAANQLAISTTTSIMNSLSAMTWRRLNELDINTEEITSEEDALAAIEAKEAEETKAGKTDSEQNAQTYYDKQIIADAIQLAQDLGLSVSQDDELTVVMDNIKDRLDELQAQLGGNENTKSVVDEYSNRYDYIYAQYMNKGSTLKNQIITSLDVMGTSGAVSAGL